MHRDTPKTSSVAEQPRTAVGEGFAPGPAWWDGLAVSAIVLVVIVAFLPALDGAFLNWDDDRNFLENESFRGFGLEEARWAWSTYHLGVWQPLSWMLLGRQWAWAGEEPALYHVVSIVLHALNCILLYRLIRRVLSLARADSHEGADHAPRFGAFAVAALFAVHPLRVEAVAWISCQPYLPSSLFYLLGILAYLRAAAPGGSAKRRIGWFAVTYCCYLIAVAFKAVAVSMPAVLLVLDAYPLRRLSGPSAGRLGRWGRVLIEKIPFAIVAVLVGWWAIGAKDFSASRAPPGDFDADARLAQSAYAAFIYIVQSVWPASLSPYYRLPADVGLGGGKYLACAIAVVATAVVAIIARRRWPALPAAMAAYLLILLPNIGLVQISQQIAADRYAYLATIPLVVLAADVVQRVWLRNWRRPRLQRAGLSAVLVVVLTIAVVATRRQIGYWQDSEALWRRVLSLDEECAVAHCNLGEALIRAGRSPEASRHLSRAIELEPDFSFAYSNFGALLCQAGRFQDAVRACLDALENSPALLGMDLARTHAILGQAYAGLREDDLAWEHTLKAKQLGFADADRMLEYLRRFSPAPGSGRR